MMLKISRRWLGCRLFARRLRTRRALAAALAGASAACIVASSSWAVPFTPGNLVVTRAAAGAVVAGGAEGSVAAINTPKVLGGGGEAASVFLDEYTTAGALVQTIALPNVLRTTSLGTQNAALTFSGTQNGEGTLTLSGDGRFLVVSGYNQTATGAAGTGTNAAASATINRVVGLIDMNGNVDTRTALTDAASGQSMRSAYTTNGTDLWVNGQNGNAISGDVTGGVLYTTVGSTTSTSISAVSSNLRIVNAFSNQLYISATGTAGGYTRGVSTLGTGLPTTGPQTPTILPNFATADATATSDDYWFKDANTLYVADQRTDGTNGGIRKFALESGSWIFKYNVTLGTQAGPTTGGNVGAHGITGADIGGVTTLFVTTFDGTGANRTKLLGFSDNGASFVSTGLSVTAPDQTGSFATAFRGVEIIPPAAPTGNANFNGDSKVDGTDFLIWQQNSIGPGAPGTGDANGDGTVNGADLTIWTQQFGTPATAVGAAVPEPCSFALIAMGLLAAAAKGRRASS